MSQARIVWNSNNLDFPDNFVSYWEAKLKARRTGETPSDGGIHGIQLSSLWFEGFLQSKNFTDSTIEAALWAWFAWAVQGKQYAIARDLTKMYSANITAILGSGATAATVASTAGPTAGDDIYFKSLTSPDIHKARISSLGGGVTINFVGYPSKYTFASGSLVRHVDYLPKVVSLDSEFPVREENSLSWTLEHRFREDAA